MKRVLVTGGTGFVGTWMQRTQPSNLDCTYIGREEYETIGPREWHILQYDYIVHLAHIPPVHVIHCAIANRARLLYCSSGVVYYSTDNVMYKQEKIRWEFECLDNYMDVVIARLFAFTGDGLDGNKAVTEFIEAAKKGEPIRIRGNGKTVRTYMHGSELGRWLWAILLKGKCGEVYDVGNDQPVSILQLAEQIRNEYKSCAPIVIEYGNDPMPNYLPPNTAKTKALL